MYIKIHDSENVKILQFFFASSSAKYIIRTSGQREISKEVHL